MIGDRAAPMLGIPLFFRMLNFFKGYNHLKQFGYLSILAGQVVAFMVVAIVIAWLARSRGYQPRRVRVLPAVLAATGLGFIACVAFLWPNLGTNYRALDPGQATIVNIAALLVECLLAAFFLARSLRTWASSEALDGTQSETDNRRRMLIVEGATAVAGLAIVGILIRFYRIAAYAYDGSINEGEQLPPITPNDKFYAVTKNNVDPRPTREDWHLRIDGKVEHPRTLTFAELEAMPSIEREVTLQCISNPVGGGLNSNAVWTGVLLRDLLQSVGASTSAVQVTLRGADGFDDDLPIQKVMDDETMLAYKMNGEPLPLKHGFPARLIVPNYVGEKSIKWITEIKVVDHHEKGFYERQGWGPQFTLNNTTRIDGPDLSDPIALGSVVMLHGMAFAGDRGVSLVEVSTDGEDTWKPAQITYRGAKTAWVQWQFLLESRHTPARPTSASAAPMATAKCSPAKTSRPPPSPPSAITPSKPWSKPDFHARFQPAGCYHHPQHESRSRHPQSARPGRDHRGQRNRPDGARRRRLLRPRRHRLRSLAPARPAHPLRSPGPKPPRRIRSPRRSPRAGRSRAPRRPPHPQSHPHRLNPMSFLTKANALLLSFPKGICGCRCLCLSSSPPANSSQPHHSGCPTSRF